MTEPEEIPPGCKPASDADLVASLSYALRFDELGKARAVANDIVTRIAAERLVQHLRASNYLILQKPPLKSHGEP